jgi:hypothetical protein
MMIQPWGDSRCGAAYDLWNLALVYGTLGRWDKSVPAYQAGISLALGRVPEPVRAEYYRALALLTLNSPNVSVPAKVAGAKYFLLAGSSGEAVSLLRELSVDGELSPAQRCLTSKILSWANGRTDTSTATPSWLARSDSAGTCANAGSEPRVSPDWQITEQNGLSVSGSSKQVIGFDLDPDVLSAGVEVVGLLYRRSADGLVKAQDFRTASLWPNSGLTWLPVEHFTTCLPGYSEPVWVSPCAGRAQSGPDATTASVDAVSLSANKGNGGTHDIPDAFINTASFNVPAGRTLVYGGRWKVEGALPHPQVARSLSSGEVIGPANEAYRYQVLIDLSDLPVNVWTVRVALAQPTPQDMELGGWIRPRSGQGDGKLNFQSVFSFVLPDRDDTQ